MGEPRTQAESPPKDPPPAAAQQCNGTCPVLDDRADLLPRLTGILREPAGVIGDMRTHLVDQRRPDHLRYLATAGEYVPSNRRPSGGPAKRSAPGPRAGSACSPTAHRARHSGRLRDDTERHAERNEQPSSSLHHLRRRQAARPSAAARSLQEGTHRLRRIPAPRHLDTTGRVTQPRTRCGAPPSGQPGRNASRGITAMTSNPLAEYGVAVRLHLFSRAKPRRRGDTRSMSASTAQPGR